MLQSGPRLFPSVRVDDFLLLGLTGMAAFGPSVAMTKSPVVLNLQSSFRELGGAKEREERPWHVRFEGDTFLAESSPRLKTLCTRG